MKNHEVKGIKSEKGFTMIELVIVIAIIGILSAILVPSFANMSRRSRLRADISTIKNVNMQIDLYEAEQDGKKPGDPDFTDTDDILHPKAVKDLVDGGYIKSSDTVGSKDEEIRLQSNGAKLIFDSTLDHLQLQFETGSKEFDLRDKAGETDQDWINATGY